MKVDKKSNESDPGVTQKNVIWINFNDKPINKLFIKSGNRITVKFKNVKVPYLTGLVLRYSPLTQKKIFIIFSNFEQDLDQIKTLILPILNRT